MRRRRALARGMPSLGIDRILVDFFRFGAPPPRPPPHSQGREPAFATRTRSSESQTAVRPRTTAAWSKMWVMTSRVRGEPDGVAVAFLSRESLLAYKIAGARDKDL